MSEAALILKDRYELERELGRGGMSVVYLARDRQLLSKRVVVKVLLQETSQDSWMRQKFLQEMEALARIDHPGVVGVLDTGLTAEGKQFLVMQYIEGATLRSAIEPGGMNFTRAAGLIRQIGQALAAAHEKGVWHRDLKPENIMLQRLGGDEHAKLIDFGIAGIEDSQFSGEKTKVAGSVDYMAPEQFAGHPCAASDTYALGVIAYELLTGNLPFSADSMMHLAEENTRPMSLRLLRRDLPAAAERAVLRAISFRPEQRQAETREFSEELFQALAGGEPARRPTASGSVEIAHVLFTDLVGYSLLQMDQQREYLGQLQQIVRESGPFRAAEAAGDIISLPTGDGMALAFFGDPTAPAQCATEVATRLKSEPHLKLRMGIHSGPVYRVADVNANANVAGGGINIAQRVMDCGDAGHILVSKSVADVLRELSQWSPYLTDLGDYTVKHGATVHLYNLAGAEWGNPKRPRKLGAAASKARSKAPLFAGVTVLALAIAAAGYRYLRHAPVLTDRDTIVLADFTNKTGDPVFDDTLRQALTLKLDESPLINILSSEKVGQTLRMMGRKPSDALTPQLAREICERNGLKAVVSGSIAQVGSNYLLRLDATNCATGGSVARAGAEVSGKDPVLRALGTAAVELRGKLGESLSSIEKFDKPFEVGTTSSLEALKFYTMAKKARYEGNLSVELALLQRAIELDPNFAIAYSIISSEYSNLRQPEKAAEYARKAFLLRDHVTQRESFNILHLYYLSVLGDMDKLIESDRLYTLAYPRDYSAFMNLGSAYGRVGQNDKGLEATRKAILLNGGIGTTTCVNTMFFCAALGRFDEAQQAYDEAKKRNLSYWRIPVFYYRIAFLRHDTTGMAQAAEEAQRGEGGQDEILVEEALVEAYYGRLQKALELLKRVLESAERKGDKTSIAALYSTRAHVEALFGANESARQDANSALRLAPERDVLSIAGWCLARTGDTPHAQAAVRELERRYPSNTIAQRVYLPVLRAELADARDQPNQAIEGLKATIPYDLTSFGRTPAMYAVYVRGEAYLQARQGQAAAAEFQKILEHPGVIMNSPVGPLARLGLARAYAIEGDPGKSRAAYQEFFTLWKDADPDLPVLVEARKQFQALR